MKKLLTILILLPTIAFGQRNITLSHTTEGITVNGTTYGKDALALTINNSDSTKAAITRAADGGIVVAMQAISYYKRSSGTAFTKTPLIAFFDSFAYSTAGASTTALRDTAAVLRWQYYPFRITGATGSSATVTIPSGKTNCILSMKNETHPTTPYSTDVIIVTPIWNISGTTLTVYLKQTGGGLQDSYTISGLVW